MTTAFEKLKLARRHRPAFTEAATVRLTLEQVRSLAELSDDTGRSASDLIRTAIDVVILIGERTKPFDLEKAVEAARKDAESHD